MQLAKHPYWHNFAQVWQNGDFANFLKNSLVITGGSLVVILAFGVGAGFVLGRYQFRGQNLILGFVLTAIKWLRLKK